MKKKFIATILIGILVIGTLSGCGNSLQENIETMTQTAETTAENDNAEAEDTAKAEEKAAAKAAAEEAAREEEANSYYETGRAYLYGMDGQEIDLKEAYTNFEKALELGKTDANFYLGVLCDWYSYPEEDYKKAKTYYEAVDENPYAQLALGFLYYNGQGVEEDAVKAQELFEAVLAMGCEEGYLGRAKIAYDEEDYSTAFENYNKVVDGQEQLYIVNAINEIGRMYVYGQGVEQDYVQAMEWFEKAADLGNSTAMN